MKQFSRVVSVFHERDLPEQGCLLAGYAALIDAYKLVVPLPEICSAIGKKHRRYVSEHWAIFTPRHKPKDTLIGHLTFALKYEGLDLAVLHTLFSCIDPKEIAAWVRLEPTGQYSRRIWFLYEWLMGHVLDVAAATSGPFVDVLDIALQYPGRSVVSKRHRVRNNLPGVPNFCPLVRCTETLQRYQKMQLHHVAQNEIKCAPQNLVARAAAFLLLNDSRASFHIEQEDPEPWRVDRWGHELGRAGLHELNKDELVRLQAVALGENKFVTFGFRREGGFIGTHDRGMGAPIPEHISARWEDVEMLLDGLVDAYQKQKNGPIDAIVLAAMISFGFVFIHPFVDGNGRIHRYLMHLILAESGFVPQGIVFPISAVILDRIDEYRLVLEDYSRPRLACIQWRPTAQGNVEVLNQTIDLYRYFDATKQAEFLYACVHQAITKSFPEEIDYLKRYDRMKAAVKLAFAMPDKMISLVMRFLEQNNGVLSKRARSDEFKALTDDECEKIEKIYAREFLSRNRFQ